MQVLVVDDDPQIQSEVSVGGDGQQALDLLASANFDLAILDLLLPRRTLRENDVDRVLDGTTTADEIARCIPRS